MTRCRGMRPGPLLYGYDDPVRIAIVDRDGDEIEDHSKTNPLPCYRCRLRLFGRSVTWRGGHPADDAVAFEQIRSRTYFLLSIRSTIEIGPLENITAFHKFRGTSAFVHQSADRPFYYPVYN